MAAAAVASPAATDFKVIRDKLNKKASFEEAVRECIDTIKASPESVNTDTFKNVLRRALTVARSRFTDTEVALWRSGLALVRAAAAASDASDAAFSAELANYENVCLTALGEDGERENISSLSRPVPILFEGQLSDLQDPSTSQAAAAPGQSAIQDLAALLLGRELGVSNANSEQQQQHYGSITTEAAQQPPPQITEEMAEALQRELDTIAVEIMEQTANDAPRAPPPASKAVLRTLPRIKITAEKLAELGQKDEARCPICFCLEVDDEILTLPCKHWAHPACLDPWLIKTNTCPTCRNELPSEDSAYDRKKERDREEAELKRGAENAVGHNEFLYI
jgi:E3 ubiquitin-protein ligase AIP2